MSADEETPEVDDEPVPCTVCRGTGTLISNLGGSPSDVECAWCEGTGVYLGSEHDAQASKRAAAADAPPPQDPDAPPAGDAPTESDS